jgi:uncharacterized membrane protein YphA (DoxX/SURF4 family)
MLMGDIDRALQDSTDVSLRTMVTVFVLLLVMTACAALTRGRWTSLASATALLGLSLAWFQVDHRWEGDILYTFTATHGLTEADLLVPAVISLAIGIRLLRWAFTPVPQPALRPSARQPAA